MLQSTVDNEVPVKKMKQESDQGDASSNGKKSMSDEMYAEYKKRLKEKDKLIMVLYSFSLLLGLLLDNLIHVHFKDFT